MLPPGVAEAMVQVPDLAAAYKHLRALPQVGRRSCNDVARQPVFCPTPLPSPTLPHTRVCATTQARIEALQAALQRERPKFYYGVPPGEQRSVLGDLLVQHMCARAAALRPSDGGRRGGTATRQLSRAQFSL